MSRFVLDVLPEHYAVLTTGGTRHKLGMYVLKWHQKQMAKLHIAKLHRAKLQAALLYLLGIDVVSIPRTSANLVCCWSCT